MYTVVVSKHAYSRALAPASALPSNTIHPKVSWRQQLMHSRGKKSSAPPSFRGGIGSWHDLTVSPHLHVNPVRPTFLLHEKHLVGVVFFGSSPLDEASLTAADAAAGSDSASAPISTPACSAAMAGGEAAGAREGSKSAFATARYNCFA